MTISAALSTAVSAAASPAVSAVASVPLAGSVSMAVPASVAQSNLLAAVTGPGAVAFVLLLLMSLLCWYFIISRLVAWGWRRHRQQQFYQAFATTSARQGLTRLLHQAPCSALQRLTQVAWFGWQQGHGHQGLADDPRGQWLASSIQDQLEKERLRLESGLTMMACVGACAPFVGLFGTVWGIYHALQVIGLSGQSSLDKVAGPVGETLIMTGCGLLVALPAVLAYNGFVRLNRRELSWLASFAQQLHSLLLWETRLTPPLLAKGALPVWFKQEGAA